MSKLRKGNADEKQPVHNPTNPLKKDFTLILGVPANGSPTPPVNVLHFM